MFFFSFHDIILQCGFLFCTCIARMRLQVIIAHSKQSDGWLATAIPTRSCSRLTEAIQYTWPSSSLPALIRYALAFGHEKLHEQL